MKVSSYQKLKQRIEKMREYQLKMLDDPAFYLTECITHKVNKDVNKILWTGSPNSEPNGFVTFNPTK